MEISQNYTKLLQYGLKILVKKRYTISEMERKLQMYIKKHDSIEEDHSEMVLERLKELEYLNDEKFADDYLADRSRFRPRGKMLLERELVQKGVASETVKKALAGLKFDEYQAALDSLLKRNYRWEKKSLIQQKAKAYQFLYSRGFARDDIYKAIEYCYNRHVI